MAKFNFDKTLTEFPTNSACVEFASLRFGFRAKLLLALALVLIAQSIDAPSLSAVSDESPNIVIILVDDMGYGDASCYNSNSKIPTPNIDSLARDGMRFTDAHAPGPLCHLSRYGLMTGEYPFRATTGKWRQQPSIASDQITIASLLNASGYQTAMVGKWHLGFYENGYDQPLKGGPVDVGFDSYFGIRASTDIPPYFYIRGDKAVQAPTQPVEAVQSPGWSPIQGAFSREGLIAPDLELRDVLPRFTQEAIEVIDNHAKSKTEKPLMLYLAYPAPHTPWLPAPEFDGKSQASMYGDFTCMVDANIGQVLKALDRNQMREDTMVIFTSDNGPVWYDADVDKYDHDSSGGLRGMKADAWECGHRMPFLIRWPGNVAEGATSDHLVCFTDLLATFADIVGKQLPPDGGPDSFSFLPKLTGKPTEQPMREHLVIAAGSKMFTIREGKWKYIAGLGSGGFSKPKNVKPVAGDPRAQLYNLDADLGETNNLYQEHPAVVSRLKSKLKEIIEEGHSR